jgi:DNA-directed RNA polymerase subunit RPC12/RpoP
MTDDNPRVDIDWAHDEHEALECPDCGARVAVAASDPRDVAGVRCLRCDAEMERIASRR